MAIEQGIEGELSMSKAMTSRRREIGFQIHGMDAEGAAIVRRARRSEVLAFSRRTERPCRRQGVCDGAPLGAKSVHRSRTYLNVVGSYAKR